MNVSDAWLVDTNVLVYAHDPRDRRKQERALLVLDRLVATERAVLSVQCLGEFFVVTTRRLPDPLSLAEALAQVERFTRSCRVLPLTPAVVVEGCRGAATHQLSFWDSLIWASAKLNQVPIVLTEDAEHGQSREGVRFLNPYHPGFDLGWIGAGAGPADC
jgi:predicted nucleic acid-binding protein